MAQARCSNPSFWCINSSFFSSCEESATVAIMFSAIQRRYWPSNNDIGLGNRVDKETSFCGSSNALQARTPIAWHPHNVYNSIKDEKLYLLRWSYGPAPLKAALLIMLGLLWPWRCATIPVFDVIHQFIIFFELRRICNCCNNIFSDPTTILTEQQRYWLGKSHWSSDMQAASSNALQASFRRSPIALQPHNVYHAAGLYLQDYGGLSAIAGAAFQQRRW